MKPSSLVGGLALVVVTLAGCGGPRSPGASVVVRDSAGVRIVESSAPAWKAGQGWKLASTPAVDIGSAEGDPHYLFSRVTSGAFLPGGGFVVADWSHTLRGYSATGAFLWSEGRQGSGPGEYQGTLSVLPTPSDSLVVLDAGLGRLSILALDGTFARSTRLQWGSTLSGSRLSGFLSDGSLVVSQTGSSGLLPRPIPAGDSRERDPVARFTLEGDSLGLVGTFPGMLWHRGDHMIGGAPFTRFAHFAVRDSTVVAGASDDMSVQLFSPGGRLRGIVRLLGFDTRLTDAQVQAYRDTILAHAPTPEVRKMNETRLAGMTFPDHRPAYATVKADPEGNLWLSGYHSLGFDDPSWYVFAPDGHYLGSVLFPDHFRVLDIASSAVLGVWTDGLDVEHLRVYVIRK